MRIKLIADKVTNVRVSGDECLCLSAIVFVNGSTEDRAIIRVIAGMVITEWHGGRVNFSVDPLFTNLAIFRMYSSKVLKSCNL